MFKYLKALQIEVILVTVVLYYHHYTLITSIIPVDRAENRQKAKIK